MAASPGPLPARRPSSRLRVAIPDDGDGGPAATAGAPPPPAPPLAERDGNAPAGPAGDPAEPRGGGPLLLESPTKRPRTSPARRTPAARSPARRPSPTPPPPPSRLAAEAPPAPRLPPAWSHAVEHLGAVGTSAASTSTSASAPRPRGKHGRHTHKKNFQRAWGSPEGVEREEIRQLKDRPARPFSAPDRFRAACQRAHLVPSLHLLDQLNGRCASLTVAPGRLGPHEAAALCSSVKLCPGLEVLDLSGNPLGDASGRVLAEGLRGMVALRILNLSGCGLRAAFADLAREVLAGGAAGALERLDLSRNPAGDKGAQKLLQGITDVYSSATGYKTGFRLAALNLAGVGLTDLAAPALAQVVRENPHLKSLDLSDNLLQPKGFRLLTDALAASAGLEEVFLTGNAVGRAGLAGAARALESPTLKWVDLAYTGVVHAGGGLEELEPFMERALQSRISIALDLHAAMHLMALFHSLNLECSHLSIRYLPHLEEMVERAAEPGGGAGPRLQFTVPFNPGWERIKVSSATARGTTNAELEQLEEWANALVADLAAARRGRSPMATYSRVLAAVENAVGLKSGRLWSKKVGLFRQVRRSDSRFLQLQMEETDQALRALPEVAREVYRRIGAHPSGAIKVWIEDGRGKGDEALRLRLKFGEPESEAEEAPEEEVELSGAMQVVFDNGGELFDLCSEAVGALHKAKLRDLLHKHEDQLRKLFVAAAKGHQEFKSSWDISRGTPQGGKGPGAGPRGAANPYVPWEEAASGSSSPERDADAVPHVTLGAFWQFCDARGVAGATAAAIDRTVAECGRVVAPYAGKEVHDPNNRLSFTIFAEALLRLSAGFGRPHGQRKLSPTQTTSSIVDRFRDLLAAVGRAEAASPKKSTLLKQLFIGTECQDVLQKYRGKLLKCYVKWNSRNAADPVGSPVVASTARRKSISGEAGRSGPLTGSGPLRRKSLAGAAKGVLFAMKAAQHIADPMYELGDFPMNFNDLLAMFTDLGLFDPTVTPKRLAQLVRTVTGHADLMPQKHQNNLSSEILFEQFLEVLLRTSLDFVPDKDFPGCFQEVIERMIFPACKRIWQGRF